MWVEPTSKILFDFRNNISQYHCDVINMISVVTIENGDVINMTYGDGAVGTNLQQC